MPGVKSATSCSIRRCVGDTVLSQEPRESLPYSLKLILLGGGLAPC